MQNANIVYIFVVIPNLKIDLFPLQLNPWNNLARHNVENAMVDAALGFKWGFPP